MALRQLAHDVIDGMCGLERKLGEKYDKDLLEKVGVIKRCFLELSARKIQSTD